MDKQLLPLGSVVQLDSYKSPVMIIGYGLGIKGSETRSDYLGVNYPFGLTQALCSLAFDCEDISEILFRGYEDEERDAFLEKLSAFYQQ